MARLLCRLFGHRVERYYVGERVGALQCTRCWARTIFRPPGVTEEQLDAVFPP
jgi:hypothetical protein